MDIRSLALLSFCMSSLSLLAGPSTEEDLISQKMNFNPKAPLTRADTLPVQHFEDATDPYLEGYIQALVDIHFYDYDLIVKVRNHKVYLYNLPKNDLMASSIINFVQDLPNVEEVEASCECPTQLDVEDREKYVCQPCVRGIWFPQSTVLFPPLVAAPREPMYKVAIRRGDHVVGNKAVAVAMGDDFPIFRWKDVFCWHGDLQVGIDAGVWGVFNFSNVPKNTNGDICEMVNADYLVGIPFSYAFDRWAHRVRIYHISSHLGDEFLCNHTEEVDARKNPSFEALDWIASYQFTQGLRLYGGPGLVFHSDDSFKLKPFYVQWGLELRTCGRKLYYHKLYGTPFLAIDLQNWQERDWSLDATYMIGYEISKLQGVGRKMRLFLDYHQGYSAEGQFFKKKTQYGEFGLSWGF